MAEGDHPKHRHPRFANRPAPSASRPRAAAGHPPPPLSATRASPRLCDAGTLPAGVELGMGGLDLGTGQGRFELSASEEAAGWERAIDRHERSATRSSACAQTVRRENTRIAKPKQTHLLLPRVERGLLVHRAWTARRHAPACEALTRASRRSRGKNRKTALGEHEFDPTSEKECFNFSSHGVCVTNRPIVCVSQETPPSLSSRRARYPRLFPSAPAPGTTKRNRSACCRFATANFRFRFLFRREVFLFRLETVRLGHPCRVQHWHRQYLSPSFPPVETNP